MGKRFFEYERKFWGFRSMDLRLGVKESVVRDESYERERGGGEAGGVKS